MYTKYLENLEENIAVKVKIGFTIEPELLKEIDELRGITKRSTFIEYIIRLGLKSYKEENPIPRSTSSCLKRKGRLPMAGKGDLKVFVKSDSVIAGNVW